MRSDLLSLHALHFLHSFALTVLKMMPQFLHLMSRVACDLYGPSLLFALGMDDGVTVMADSEAVCVVIACLKKSSMNYMVFGKGLPLRAYFTPAFPSVLEFFIQLAYLRFALNVRSIGLCRLRKE